MDHGSLRAHCNEILDPCMNALLSARLTRTIGQLKTRVSEAGCCSLDAQWRSLVAGVRNQQELWLVVAGFAKGCVMRAISWCDSITAFCNAKLSIVGLDPKMN